MPFAGRVKALTTGAEASERVMLTAALRLAETLPAASFAQAKKVTLPAAGAVTETGAVAVQPAAEASGAVALVVTR